MCLGWWGPVAAQAPWPVAVEALEARFVERRWTTREALPQNSVSSILQSKDGALWLATFGGVARFDGREFERFDPAVTSGLGSARALALAEDEEGRLWVGAQEHGVSWLEGERARACVGCPEGTIRALAAQRGGVMWIGTEEGLWRWEANEAVRVEGVGPTAALLVEGERVLAGGRDGLFVLEAGGSPRLLAPMALEGEVVLALARDRDGALWVGTRTGLWMGREGSLARVWGEPGVRREVESLWGDRQGGVWIGTVEGLLWRERGAARLTALRGMGQAQGVLGVRSLFEDREGNVWVGSNGVGLWRLRGREARLYDQRQGLGGQGARSLVEDAQGSLWVTTSAPCEALSRRRVGEASFSEVSVEGLGSGCLMALARGAGGGLWVAQEERLYRLREGQAGEEVIPGRGAPGHILSLLEGRGGALWVGTRSEGLYRRAPAGGAWARLGPEEGALPGRRVTALVEAGDGAVWVGTERGVARLAGEARRVWGPAEGLPAGPARDIFVDPRGVAWVAHYGGGLSRIEGDRITRYTTREGLWDNALSRILPDARGDLWINSNRGLFRVAVGSLEDFAAGRSPEVRVTSYDSAEGNGGVQPAGWGASDGALWFPTLEGALRIDPARVRANTAAPTTRITGVEVNGHPERAPSPGQALRIGPGRRDLRVYFAAQTLLHPEGVRFRYRLEGYDRGWVEAGSRREAIYTNLPPGAYRFQVRASNSDGLWGEPGAPLSLSFSPGLLERRAFWWGLLLGGVVLALALHLRRLRAVERRNQARQEAEAAQRDLERQLERARRLEAIGRLAGGLAHDINNIMTAISLEAQHLAESPALGVREPAEAILESSQRAVTLTRQLLTFSQGRALQAATFDVAQTLRAMEPSLARLVHAGVQLQLSVPARPAWMEASAAQLEQVLLNLVLNASDAMPAGGALQLRLALPEPGWLRLEVQDQGVGIDAALQEQVFEPFFTTKPHGEGSGLGLSSVHGIVHQWGGRIELQSAPGAGTTVRLWLPAAAAPAAAASPRAGVLLCEANEVIRQTAARVLRKAGHEVQEARTLAEAQALLGGAGPGEVALLIFDAADAAEAQRALAALRARHPEARALLLSGASGALREILHQPGCAALPRPFTADQLVARVAALLQPDRREGASSV